MIQLRVFHQSDQNRQFVGRTLRFVARRNIPQMQMSGSILHMLCAVELILPRGEDIMESALWMNLHCLFSRRLSEMDSVRLKQSNHMLVLGIKKQGIFSL